MGEKREKLRNELAKLRLTQGESDSSLQTRLDQLEADCGDIKGSNKYFKKLSSYGT